MVPLEYSFHPVISFDVTYKFPVLNKSLLYLNPVYDIFFINFVMVYTIVLVHLKKQFSCGCIINPFHDVINRPRSKSASFKELKISLSFLLTITSIWF